MIKIIKKVYRAFDLREIEKAREKEPELVCEEDFKRAREEEIEKACEEEVEMVHEKELENAIKRDNKKEFCKFCEPNFDHIIFNFKILWL